MNHRWNVRIAGLVVAALIAISAFGCSKKLSSNLVPNQRPTVVLTSGPINKTDMAFYNVQLNWSGYDPDGRVDHFLFAIDPPPGHGPGTADTVWEISYRNELTQDTTFRFKCTTPLLPDSGKTVVRGYDFHTFAIKAIDNLGLASAVVSREFTSYTVAPSVSINNPRPDPSSDAHVTPAMTITWSGIDPDGIHTQKPVRYKYKLIEAGSPEFNINDLLVTGGTDSLRNTFSRDNFSTWTTVGGDTTSVQFTNLTPQEEYAFVVIGYDEAGAYNADFSRNTNVLMFTVGYAGTLGPKITVFNEFYFYQMTSGGNAPGNPASWQYIEVPTDTKLTFNWFATPPQGSAISWYRWRLDGEVEDETPRTNETTDWYHWSQPSVNTTSATFGPFTTAQQHFFYIQAQDNNDMRSTLVLVLKPILPTMNTSTGKDLLVVDDTRSPSDKISGGVRVNSGGEWPSRSEIDTLLFAVGGVPWRYLYAGQPARNSTPGFFHGYSFDTLGTWMGYVNGSAAVPFSTLSKYRHIVWLVDNLGATSTFQTNDKTKPMSVLRYMTKPGHNNTFSTYTYAGGKMWLVGGGGAYAAMINYDQGSKGATFGVAQDDNNNDYGGSGVTVFAGPGFAHRAGHEELSPGRVMYDGPKWQSIMIHQSGIVIPDGGLYKSPTVNQPRWVDQPGYKYSNPIHRPDYTMLPSVLHGRTNITVDPVYGELSPPQRPVNQDAGFFSYPPSASGIEYLMAPNYVIEDMNPNAIAETLETALDTLYSVDASDLKPAAATFERPTMTWYHGTASPDFIFTGFPIWGWRSTECQSIVDFVLQKIWGLSKSTSPATAASRHVASPSRRSATPATPATGAPHMPVWRSGRK